MIVTWRGGVLAAALALAVAAPPAADARAGHGHGIGHAIGHHAHHVRNKKCQHDVCKAPKAADAAPGQSTLT